MHATFAVTAEPVARRISAWLRHAIITMQIKPGEKLSEHDIAGRFSVSRQPVREAFIKMAEAGLVRVLPQRGTLVVKISVAAVEEARFVRQALECAVARSAVLSVTQHDVAQLKANLAAASDAMKAGRAEDFFAKDEDFHALLAQISGHPNVWRIIMEQKAQMDRVRYLDVSESIPMQVVIDQHGAIVAALEARNADAAEHAMRDHLNEITRKLPLLAARFPDLFDAG